MNRRWSLAILALAPLALSASAFAEGGRLAGSVLPGLGERAAAILAATRAMATLPPGTGALMFYDPATDVAGAADSGLISARMPPLLPGLGVGGGWPCGPATCQASSRLCLGRARRCG